MWCNLSMAYSYRRGRKTFLQKKFENFMSTRVGDHRDWSNAEKHVQTNQDQVLRRWKFIEKHFKKNMNVLQDLC